MSAISQNELTALHRTAFSAAALRAAHTICGGDPKIFKDEFALALTGMAEEEILNLAKRVPAASASTCVLRSRFAEERLSIARARLNQYVILGAGLDSYALRMRDRLDGLFVFEVDDPPFQDWKQQHIAKLGFTLPAEVRFAPCDFEHMSIAQALARHGFKEGQPCFISWLGVTQYLTPAAIQETLGWAGGLPKGSEIVLSFLEANAQAESLKVSMAQSGVEVLSAFTQWDMTKLLRNAGFDRIEHLSSADANDQYFRERSDGLRAPEIQQLVSAVV